MGHQGAHDSECGSPAAAALISASRRYRLEQPSLFAVTSPYALDKRRVRHPVIVEVDDHAVLIVQAGRGRQELSVFGGVNSELSMPLLAYRRPGQNDLGELLVMSKAPIMNGSFQAVRSTHCGGT
jgi:hypothetical protein